jgi:hypothetical protein
LLIPKENSRKPIQFSKEYPALADVFGREIPVNIGADQPQVLVGSLLALRLMHNKSHSLAAANVSCRPKLNVKSAASWHRINELYLGAPEGPA